VKGGQRRKTVSEQVRSISRPDQPFPGGIYSPGSLTPAADFSFWMAKSLGACDWDSILEFLAFVANRGAAPHVPGA